MVIVHEKDKKATLAHGEVLVVKLPAKLGTGYGWQLAKHSKCHLKRDGEPKVEDIPTEGDEKTRIGGAQYQVFRFRPGEPGLDVLELEYRRPFETDTPPRKTYKLEVTVRRSRD